MKIYLKSGRHVLLDQVTFVSYNHNLGILNIRYGNRNKKTYQIKKIVGFELSIFDQGVSLHVNEKTNDIAHERGDEVASRKAENKY